MQPIVESNQLVLQAYRLRLLLALMLANIRLVINWVRDRHVIRRRRELAKIYKGTPESRAIADGLEEVGFYFTNLRRLGINEAVLDYCRELTGSARSLSIEDVWAQNYESIYHRNEREGYWIDLHVPMRQERTPLLEFATNEIVVGAACTYLKEVPFLTGLGLFYTPAHADKVLYDNQFWHLDGRRPSQVKIFMLPDGGDEESGPLYLIPKAYSNRRRYTACLGRYTDEQIVENGVDISKRIPFVGPPGSIVFADTSRLFHCGGRTRNKPRSQVIINWSPVESYLPYKFKQKQASPGSKFPDVNRDILRYFSGLI